MSNNICNNIAYLNALDQKRRFQLLNIPPVRYDNLATNPYQELNGQPANKKFDLDMRRKAEILKYSSNRMSTQTNSLTKAQRYAQAIKGVYKRRTYSQEYIDDNIMNGVLNTCPQIMKSTTASNVPGPPMLLYEDPTVPLYNLINTADGSSYGILNQDQTANPIQWKQLTANDVSVPNDTIFSTIATIYATNISVPSYNFNISMPVVLNIRGSLLPESQGYSSERQPISININIGPFVNVKYSNSNVPLHPATTCSFLQNPNINITKIDLTKQKPSYSATIYVGLLNINNLILPFQTGFIYEIQVAISYGASTINSYNTQCNLPVITSNINSTEIVNTDPTNCTISGNVPIPNPKPVLQITGGPG